MDADRAVQLLFRQATLERSGEALRHFSSVGTQYVKAHDTFAVLEVTDDLCIAFVVIPGWNGPLQRPKETVVNFDIFFPKFLYGFFLREATTAVLQRSKYSCWDIVIVTLCQTEKKIITRGKMRIETLSRQVPVRNSL